MKPENRRRYRQGGEIEHRHRTQEGKQLGAHLNLRQRHHAFGFHIVRLILRQVTEHEEVEAGEHNQRRQLRQMVEPRHRPAMASMIRPVQKLSETLTQ